MLGTNDIDFRARPHSAEEADFLGALVAGNRPGGDGVTYADLEAPRPVFLVGLRARGGVADGVPAAAQGVAQEQDRGVRASRRSPPAGLTKLGGALIQAAPGTETEVLHALRERRSELEGPASAIAEGSDHPRRRAARDGARGAVGGGDARRDHRCPARVDPPAGRGARRPRGRLPARPAARWPARRATPRPARSCRPVWGVDRLPAPGGRDTGDILARRLDRSARRPRRSAASRSDLPDQDDRRPGAGPGVRRQPGAAGQPRPPAAADVVLPVAPVAEKAGAFVNWEGRVVPFHGGPGHPRR